AIGEIKKAGYDVFLVLEATIGFNRRYENADEEEAEDVEVTEAAPKTVFETTGKIKLTSQDHRFLRALKIAVDDEKGSHSGESNEHRRTPQSLSPEPGTQRQPATRPRPAHASG